MARPSLKTNPRTRFSLLRVLFLMGIPPVIDVFRKLVNCKGNPVEERTLQGGGLRKRKIKHCKEVGATLDL
jgi:hypothetical protein